MNEEFSGDFGEIVNIVGVEKAQQIVDLLGGTSVYIPKTIQNSQRNRDIFHAWASGSKTPAQIAREYGLTESHVRNILKAERGKKIRPACDLDALLQGGE